jgi:uncharacterized membrane protein
MLVGLRLILGGKTKGDNILATTHVLYPTISKYHSAIRHPQIAFNNLDPILVAGKPVEKAPNSQGFKDLWSAAGGFACAFKYETFHPKKLWAVRCFLQSTSSVATHYPKVSSRLPNIPCSSYFVECSFLAQGIRVDGNLYPTVKMEWADGKDLRTFIRENLNNKNKLDLLAQAWVKLSKDLADNGIAHGDLQHGNITVDSGVNLKLIDYDSLYFSVDGNGIIDEIKGLDGYQHKLRKKLQNQCIQIDFFPQLVIYLSIVAIAEKPQLWNHYNLNNTERLLFSVTDLENPDQAQVFQVLSQMSPNIARLANELKKICNLTDFSKIPSLDTVLTPPVTKWNPIVSGTTSQPQNPHPQRWNPSGATATNPSQNPQPQTWNPGGSGTTSQPQNPHPQTWNPSGATATNPSQNPQPQTWNPTGSSSINPIINTLQTSLTQQTQKGSYPILVKTIAVISTVIAATLGGFCYYQYQQLNQIRQQIEKRIEEKTIDKKLPTPRIINKPSLSFYLQDLFNVVKGENSLLSLDIEELVTRLERDKSSSAEQVNEMKQRIKEVEKKNSSLQDERDELQNKVNEFEKYTYVNFCNKTSLKIISAAFAYWDGKGLRSRGWWNIEQGKCMEVPVEQNYRGNLYIHGDYNRGEKSFGSGDTSFCVDIINSFKIPNSDKASCSGNSLKKVTMSEFAVSPGTNIWSFGD